MENDAKYFERAIEILFEAKERDFRRILYKVAAIYPRALVEAKDGVAVTPDIPTEVQDRDLLIIGDGVSDEGNAVRTTSYSAPQMSGGTLVHTPTDDGSTTTVVGSPINNDRNIVDVLYMAGWKTDRIARAAGVSHTTVYKWKNKTQRPNALRTNMLRKSADDAGVSY